MLPRFFYYPFCLSLNSRKLYISFVHQRPDRLFSRISRGLTIVCLRQCGQCIDALGKRKRVYEHIELLAIDHLVPARRV